MNYSRITDQLYIGTTPKGGDYDLLRELGVSLVINMRIGTPPKRDPHIPPVHSLWLPSIDSPLFPIPMLFLQKGVGEALAVIHGGGIVYAHCSKGRHRGAAMAACILVAQGIPADQAIELIKRQRPISDPYAWYIHGRINKFSKLWSASKKGLSK